MTGLDKLDMYNASVLNIIKKMSKIHRTGQPRKTRATGDRSIVRGVK